MEARQIETSDTTLERISLPPSGIEVWQARLDLHSEEVMRCEKFLSRDELLRCDRFHFEHDRRRFIVARAKLRLLLGRYLQIKPAAIEFAYMKNGKPIVRGTSEGVHFNVSHSEERALYAVSKRCRLGVDIEFLNRDIDWHGLVSRFFTEREFAALQHLSASIRKRAFFACWTRKEAILKATGDGLSLPLDQFEVSVDPDAEPRMLAAAHLRIHDWTLYSTDVGSDYFATVAAYWGELPDEMPV